MAEGRSDRELDELDEAIGMAEDPAQVALDDLRRHQEAIGMRFDDPDAPVAPMHPEAAPDEEFR